MARPTQRNGEYFSNWYEKHKEELSAKRKHRYATDPEYRAKALARRAAQREKIREQSPVNPVYTKTFSDAAKELGISLWRLRNWRLNNYFPHPHSHGKFLYFTDFQVQLLQKINEFVGENPRLNAEEKEKMKELSDFIYANWNVGLTE